MSDDDKALVERLRGYKSYLIGDEPRQAADRIDALLAEIERLREALKALIDNYAPVSEPGYLWPEARAALGETE